MAASPRIRFATGLAALAGVLPVLLPAPSFAAGGERAPLVQHVVGNCYERRTFDADGTVTAHQRIYIHGADHGPDGPQARIDVVSFKLASPDHGKLQVDDKFNFRILGKATQAARNQAALQIVGHAGSHSRIALEFLGDTTIYPPNGCSDQALPPVRLSLSAQGGLVKLLGGHAEIRISDRRCRAEGNQPAKGSPYLITGSLRMKIYLLGIRIKNERYSTLQIVEPGRGLRRYRLDKRGGGRQELALIDRSYCSAPWKALSGK